MTRWSFIVVSVTTLLAVGCGGSSDTVEPATPVSLVASGWAAFEDGNYAVAASQFQRAIDKDAFDAAAHNGLGFSNMKLDKLAQALGNFDEAVLDGFTGADPLAGKAVILRDIEPVDYTLAIEAANAALSVDPQFTFEHDTNFDHKDVQLVITQAYFALRDYENANAALAALCATVQDELCTVQDPVSPTFVEDLLAEIQRLGDWIGN